MWRDYNGLVRVGATPRQQPASSGAAPPSSIALLGEESTWLQTGALTIAALSSICRSRTRSAPSGSVAAESSSTGSSAGTSCFCPPTAVRTTRCGSESSDRRNRPQQSGYPAPRHQPAGEAEPLHRRARYCEKKLRPGSSVYVARDFSAYFPRLCLFSSCKSSEAFIGFSDSNV